MTAMIKRVPIGIINDQGKIEEGVMVPEVIAKLPRYRMTPGMLPGGHRVVETHEDFYGKWVNIADVANALNKL